MESAAHRLEGEGGVDCTSTDSRVGRLVGFFSY